MTFGDITEPRGEREMLIGREVLSREEGDLVREEGPTDLGHRRRLQWIVQADAADLRARRTCQGSDGKLDVRGNGRQGRLLLFEIARKLIVD